jgi:hypothetical protein
MIASIVNVAFCPAYGFWQKPGTTQQAAAINPIHNFFMSSLAALGGSSVGHLQ